MPMTNISIEDVKKLRDETGVSIMQCKKALEEAGGDFEKAKLILRKISAQIAEKKAERELGAGAVQAYVHAGNTVAGVVVLACETDFVAKNEEFVNLAKDIAMHVAAMSPQYLSREDVSEEDLNKAKEFFAEEVKDKPEDIKDKIIEGKLNSYFKDKVLLEQEFIKDSSKTIKDLLSEATQKFGERVDIVSFERFSV